LVQLSILRTFLVFMKILFKTHIYSFISNYWITWRLGLIKKTSTVAGKDLLMRSLEELTNVLVVSVLLLGKYLEFGLDVVLGVLYPVWDVQFGFCTNFVLCEVEYAVLGVLR